MDISISWQNGPIKSIQHYNVSFFAAWWKVTIAYEKINCPRQKSRVDNSGTWGRQMFQIDINIFIIDLFCAIVVSQIWFHVDFSNVSLKMFFHIICSLFYWSFLYNFNDSFGEDKCMYIISYIVMFLLQWLQNYVDKIKSINVFETKALPNHVLINEYLPGQGIMVRLHWSTW